MRPAMAHGESVAQQVEHNTFNVGVLGSSPSGFTESYPRKRVAFLLPLRGFASSCRRILSRAFLTRRASLFCMSSLLRPVLLFGALSRVDGSHAGRWGGRLPPRAGIGAGRSKQGRASGRRTPFVVCKNCERPGACCRRCRSAVIRCRTARCAASPLRRGCRRRWWP